MKLCSCFALASIPFEIIPFTGTCLQYGSIYSGIPNAEKCTTPRRNYNEINNRFHFISSTLFRIKQNNLWFSGFEAVEIVFLQHKI